MKNLKLTTFEEFKKSYLDNEDKIKVFKYFQQYNNCFKLITQEDIDDCQNALYLEKARKWSAFLTTGMLIWTFDKNILRRKVQTRKPLPFIFKYACLPTIAYQITQKYFCKDIDQIFHDMAEKYQFTFEQYHQAMELMAKAHRANKLNEYIEQGSDFDWTQIQEQDD